MSPDEPFNREAPVGIDPCGGGTATWIRNVVKRDADPRDAATRGVDDPTRNRHGLQRLRDRHVDLGDLCVRHRDE